MLSAVKIYKIVSNNQVRKKARAYSAVNTVTGNVISKTDLASFSKTSALVCNFNLNFLMQAQNTVYRNFTGFYKIHGQEHTSLTFR